MTTCNTTKAESESKDARTNQHLSKFAKITEGIMTSHGCFLCLLLFSVILIEPSEAGCMDHFTKEDWNTTTLHRLPENITVKIMNKSEDIIVCSLTEAKDCDNKKEETCFLRDCFKDENNMDYKPPCNETDENISVPFYHFMCLTNIAKGLRDKTNGGSQKPTAEDICKVYEKVCKRDSPNPAKTTTPTACTATTTTTQATTNKTTATPSATATTEATTNKTTATPSATATTEATTNKTTATPSATATTEATTNKTTATPSATTTTEATTNKTTATPSATTTTEATTNKTTATPSATTTTEATTNKTTATPSATATTEATTNKTTATPSATATTEATTNKTTATPSATATTEATTNKTTATPSATATTEATTNKTTATPSATATTEATTNKTTATPSATTTTEATTNKTTATPSATATTEATTKNPQVSTTAVSTITTPSSPLNLQQKDETLQGESAGKKARILHIIIGVLTFTNFLWAVAFYMYTQRLQRSNEIPNLKEEEAMTVRNTFRSDIGEGSILLMTPESSIIINSPETTIIESPCPHRTHL
nr:flocculation protein FLO11 isoform X3 [Maylandia zebra]